MKELEEKLKKAEDDSTYENAYYYFYKGKYDIWLKAKSVLEKTK